MRKLHKILITVILIIFVLGNIGYFYNYGQEPSVLIVDHNTTTNPIFSDLPLPHKNFLLIKRNFYDGQIKDFSKLSESVYKRPEFYPTWESSGIRWFTEHDYSRWGVRGWGIFPGLIDYSVRNIQTGDKLIFYTFLHSSWGIETWQGLRIIPVYNTTLFDAKISPDIVLLEPTFPKFYNNWTYIIEYNVTAKSRIPQGTYTFSIRMDSPSVTTNELWAWDVLDKYTNNEYSDQINKCKQKIVSNCDTLIQLRQNKYISGALFSPDNAFTANLHVE